MAVKRLKVLEVKPGELGSKIGIQVGDFLDSYDGRSLHSTEAMLTMIENGAGNQHALTVIKNGRFVDLPCESGRLGVLVKEVNLDEFAYELSHSDYRKAKNPPKTKQAPIDSGKRSLYGYILRRLLIWSPVLLGLGLLCSVFIEQFRQYPLYDDLGTAYFVKGPFVFLLLYAVLYFGFRNLRFQVLASAVVYYIVFVIAAWGIAFIVGGLAMQGGGH